MPEITPLRVEPFQNLAEKAKYINTMTKLKEENEIEETEEKKEIILSENEKIAKITQVKNGIPLQIKVFSDDYRLKQTLPSEIDIESGLLIVSKILSAIVDIDQTNIIRKITPNKKRSIHVVEGKPLGTIANVDIFDGVINAFYKEIQMKKFTSATLRLFLYNFYDGKMTKDDNKSYSYAYLRYMRDSNLIVSESDVSGNEVRNIFRFLKEPFTLRPAVHVDYDANYNRDQAIREREALRDNLR